MHTPSRTSASDQSALFTEAVSHHQAGRLAEAESLYRQLLGRGGIGLAEVHNNLGVLLRQQGKLTAAADHFRQAIGARPDYGEAHNNLGLTYNDRGDASLATTCFRNALALQPAHPHALSNLGVACQELAEDVRAIEAYRRAIAVHPGMAGTHYNMGQALLLQGRYEEGWREHEWLWRGGAEQFVPRRFTSPRWTGQALAGKTILLYGEQGLGDTLQFARFAGPIAARGGRVILEVHPPLARLLESMPEVAQVVARGQPLPPVDYHLPMMGAPFVLGTTLDSIPASLPYVTADATQAGRWAERLASRPGVKVGLVWAGDPRSGNPRAAATDRRRSIRLAELEPLLAIPGATFVSLQMGQATEQLNDLPPALRPLHWMDEVSDFADTAALIAGLDLVVTVDTAVGHLAGALAKPVWIASRFDGCWRWLQDREDSPWYSTARLFRQTAPGDWAPVVAKMKAELEGLVGSTLRDGPDGPPQGEGDLANNEPHPEERRRRVSKDACDAAANDFDTLHQHGLTALQSGDAQAAVQWFTQAVLCRRGHAGAHDGLGLALVAAKRFADAAVAFRMAAVLDPEAAEIRYHLGTALHDMDDLDGAILAYRQALALRPDDALALANLGSALGEQARLEDAVAASQRAVAIAPGQARAWSNLGASLHELHRIDDAIFAYRQAVALAPHLPEAHHNLATALLLRGDTEEGWAEYEWRWKGGVPGLVPRSFDRPLWRGEDLAGQTILLHGEQGLGDVLQFARYATQLADRGARVVLEVYPPLVRLLSTIPGVAQVVAASEPLPAFDCHLSMMGAPQHLGPRLADIPAQVPYIAAQPADIAHWARRLAHLTGSKVGLVWAGDPRTHNPRNHAVDKRRSIALADLAPLLTTPGVSFVSLQKGAAAGQIAELDKTLRPFDPMAEVEDFADTAALVANLDLVITVDTSVAHLAGALGKPVWILNRFNGCWRWFDEREDSPWYPTARLFRQTAPGDWDGVVRRVKEALEGLVRSPLQVAPASLPAIAAQRRQAGPVGFADDANTLRAKRAEARPTVSDNEDFAQLFAQAVTYHQAGRLAEAEALYRQILAGEPNNVGCLFHLGLIAQHCGQHAATVALLGHAATLNGAIPGLHDALGSSLAALGRFDEAAAAHRRAVALQPDFVEALYNLGNACMALGRTDQATACFRQTLAYRPDLAEPYNNLGNLHSSAGRLDDAATAFRRAAILAPQVAAGHNNLGNVWKEQGRLEEAEACFLRALALAADYVEAHYNLANVLLERGDFVSAAARFRHAIAARPDLADAYNNLGSALYMGGFPLPAVTSFQRALTLDPRCAQAETNLGSVHRERGEHAAAVAAYRQAIAIDPDYSLAHSNLAMVLLLQGDYPSGLREFEWRRRTAPKAAARDYPRPAWTGESLAGRTILLHAEQGLGDTLQFVRYAPILAAGGARVVVEAYPPLARLLATVPGVAQVVATGQPLPDHDVHLSLVSLPYLLGTTVDTIPADVPYVSANPEQAAAWGRRLARLDGPKVGLVWAGDPRPHDPHAHAVDRRRSMRLDQLVPLLAVPGVSFVSLQKGAPAAQLDGIAPELRPLDLMDDVADFADTAALVANLDLVISVDTSVVHLAGAMGKPTWILSRFDGCWRWLENREDSPWYPTARLFRQPAPGDWPTVVARVAEALEAL